MTHDVLMWIWRSTLVASVALCIVLALRLFARRRLGAQAAYVLWLLVPVALLAMLFPAPSQPLIEALRVSPAMATTTATIALSAATESAPIDLRPLLLGAWAVGAFAMLGALAWQQRRYLRALGPLVSDADGALRAHGVDGSPALVGALFPRIVLPADFEARFDARERELVLAHERAHLGHGDAQINALAALMRCLQWFNPLVHFAASRLRIDQELACDARVIARFPEARRPYADAMLKAQLIGEARQELRLPIGCYWPSSHPLKERISMLKLPVPTRKRRALASGVAMVLALGGGYASWAAQTGKSSSSTPADVIASNNDAVAADFVISIDGVKVLDTTDMPQGRRMPGDWEVEIDSKHGGAIVGRDNKHIQLVTASDDPLTVSLRKDNESWTLTGNTEALSDGKISFAATLQHNGEVVSEPKLVAGDGELVAVEVGTAKSGSSRGFEGIRIDYRLMRAQGWRYSQSGSLTPPSVQGAIVPPSEDLQYREVYPPIYPAEAAKAGLQGRVMLSVHINADGNPLDAQVVSVEPKEARILSDAAIASAMQWRYNPGSKDGKTVDRFALVPVDFRVDPAHPTAPAAKQAASYRRMRPPQYPAAALAERATGTVWVRARLSAEGAVTEAHAELTWPQSASELAEAAVAAIRGWTFNPPSIDGTAVEGEVVVPLQFVIDGYQPPPTNEPAPTFPPQTPLLATIKVTGAARCGGDCAPLPAPKPPVPDPPLPQKA